MEGGENDAVHSLDLIAVSSAVEAATAATPDLSIDLLRSRSERLLSRLAKRWWRLQWAEENRKVNKGTREQVKINDDQTNY